MTDAEIETLLADAGLARGALPLTAQQLNDRVMSVMERFWPLPMREARPDAYALWRAEMEPARLAAVEANLFNARLAALLAARERLARPRLAEGRAALTVTLPTGRIDPETGTELVETITIPAIDPAPALIESPAFDPGTGAQTGTVLVANPAVATDDAERAAAEAVLAGTPAEVVAFADGGA